MNCKKARSLFEAFISGDLDQDLAEPLKSHLQYCPNCQRALNKEKSFLVNLRKELFLGSPQLAPNLNWEQVKAFEEKKGRKRFAPSYALLVVFCIGVLLLLSPLSLDLIRGINPGNYEVKSTEIAWKDSGFPHNPPSQEGLNYRIAFY